MENNKRKIIIAWAGTLSISPIFISILLGSNTERFLASNFFWLYFLFAFIGTIYAIPTLISLVILNLILKDKKWWNNLTISILGIILIFSSFLILDLSYYNRINMYGIQLPTIYSIIFVLFAFFSEKITLFKNIK